MSHEQKILNLRFRLSQAVEKSDRQNAMEVDALYIAARTILTELEAEDPEIATRNNYAFSLKHVEDALDIGYKWSEIPTLPAGLQDYNNLQKPQQ